MSMLQPAPSLSPFPAAAWWGGRLSLEWQAFVTRTHALRKVFVSVKGIYFQVPLLKQAQLLVSAGIPSASAPHASLEPVVGCCLCL